MALLLVFAALFGLAIGSFLNVVIWRVPRGESVVSPPSACPQCHNEIRARDNVPVLGWVVLRGKCRDCGLPISARYPAVEALCAVLFVVMAARFGPDAALPAFLVLAAAGLALALIDIDVQRLPDALTLPLYPVLGVLLLVATAVHHDAHAALRTVAGGAAMYGAYFLTRLAYPRGMGGGDVKLAGSLGMALGYLSWGTLAAGYFLGFLVGGAASIALVLFKDAGRKTRIPFGPYMLTGALIGILVGQRLVDAYLDLTVH